MVYFIDIYHYFGILAYIQTVLFRRLRCIFYQDTVTVDCFIPKKQLRGRKQETCKSPAATSLGGEESTYFT